MDYIFTYHSKSQEKDYDIDLYDIVSCRTYRIFDRSIDMWTYNHVAIEVEGDYEYKRYILDEEQYKRLLDVARQNMDSFSFMFGKTSDERHF